MKVERTTPNPYPRLVDALRLLPRIRPVCERLRLGEAKHEASLSRDRKASINGVSVTLLELEQLFLNGECSNPRISQAGAALLLRLYEQGAFDLVESRSLDGGVELLTQYSKGLATLLDSKLWGRDRQPRASAGTVKLRKVVPVVPSIAPWHVLANLTVHRLT